MKFFARSSPRPAWKIRVPTGSFWLLRITARSGRTGSTCHLAANFPSGPNDDGLADVALLHAAAWDRLLHRHHDDVADGGITPMRPPGTLMH